MKIAILYICNGRYDVFWKDFYLSSEKYFINDAEKHYFVFTDSNDIYNENIDKKIHKIYQNNLGWPNNTLKRYEIFTKINDKLKEFDYIFFMNANLLFLKQVDKEDFLPSGNKTLTACLHPGYYNQNRKKFTYESNPNSLAFIPKNEGNNYFAGGINGGITLKFLEVINILKKNIDEDLKNNIIAVWHDESHWNKYINEHIAETKIISPSYLFPENSNIPFKPIILIRDKNILGGHSKFRNKIEIRLIVNKIKSKIKNILK